jgi:hypothetical protein
MSFGFTHAGLFLFGVNSLFLCQLACRLAAVIGVGCRQPNTDVALVDLEPQAALTIIIGLLTQFRVFGCVLPQPLL